MSREHFRTRPIDIDHVMAHEMEPPSDELWDAIEVFPGAFFGWDKPQHFENKFWKDMQRHPDRTKLVIAIGEPASGKTVLSRSFVDKIKAKGKNSKKTNKIILDEIPWGTSFHKIPKDPRLENVDYHLSDELRRLKQEEVNKATAIWETALEYQLRKYSSNSNRKSWRTGENVNHIIMMDIPLNSGAIIDGKKVGIIRGFNQLYDLIQRKGYFEEMSYDPYIISVVADPQVRARNKDTRKIQFEEMYRAEKKQHLAERGIVFDTDDDSLILEYGIDDASLKEIELIEQDVDELLQRFDKEGLIKPPKYGVSGINMYTSLGLQNLQHYRTQLIAQIQLPWFMKTLGVDTKKAIVVHNKVVLDNVNVHTELAKNNPVNELFEDAA